MIKGIMDQINQIDTKLSTSMEDFQDMMDLLHQKAFEATGIPKSFIIHTGTGGFLKVMLSRYGKNKLPRKIKKKIFMTKKLRQKHIPEYYK